MESSRRGIALILVLWILAALIVLALGLGVTVRSEVQIARNYADLVRCRWAARAGVNSAISKIERLAEQPGGYLTSASPPRRIEPGEFGSTLSSEEQQINLGDASFEVKIEDEAGKVNINAAPGGALEALFGEREIADCIIDWRDKDNLPQSLGAETQYYSRLGKPYRAKNAPFDTVGELVLVKGVTSEMLSAPLAANGRTLGDLITVYSYDKNLAADGKKRIDIRTASKEELKAKLGDVLTDQDIDAITKWRGDKETPSKPGEEKPPSPVRGAENPPKPDEEKTPSPSRGKGFRSAAEIANVPGLSREKVQRIYDRITASDAKVRPGRININTAPAEVLAVAPGLDGKSAEEIVAYREENGPFEDVGRLLAVKAISEQAFAKSADYLTARSCVFKLISTGRLAREQSSLVIMCIVDINDGKAQIRYWRE